MKSVIRKWIVILLSALLLLSAGLASYADEVVFGDADGDGEVTAQDASCITRHLTRFKMMDAAAMTRADYDGDGKVTERDASMILNTFMATEYQTKASKAFSILVTSDLAGVAWDPLSTADDLGSTAMNVAACAMAMREADPSLLLLDAGGSLYGSAIADEYVERTGRRYGPITSLFIKMDYDAVLLGDEAMSYPSEFVRRDVNELIDRKIPVLGANLQKSDPTIFDPKGVLWNDLVPYVILEVPQDTEDETEVVRVAVIGMTQPDLTPSDDEVLPVDPLDTYADLRKELKNRADYTVLLYHGDAESDATGKSGYSLRDMLKKTDSIDLVLCAHGYSFSIRSECNHVGAEVPIVTLPGGTKEITKISVALREKGRPAILVDTVDTSAYVPDESVQRAIRPYISSVSAMMDAAVCTIGDRIEATQLYALGSSDGMDLIHETQIFAARKWIENDDLDMPHTIVSIAYPYIVGTGLKEGTMTYRDVCRLQTETPKYTLMLVRGAELRAWLSDYSSRILNDETVYSLYGLNYLLNTLNPETPLGFLEHSSGLVVEDDEVFTLILAEEPGSDPVIQPFLDESWMRYGDRVIADFSLPRPYRIATADNNPVLQAIVAYLETVGELKLSHLYSWIVI